MSQKTTFVVSLWIFVLFVFQTRARLAGRDSNINRTKRYPASPLATP